MVTETPDGLFSKLARVMGKLNNVPKTGTNTYFNYKFVTMEAVSEAVRQLLADEEIAFFASITKRELVELSKSKSNSKTGEITVEKFMRWVIDFEFTFACGDETHVCTWMAEADAADDKGINKCASAAEKYFLLKTFIISTGNEPDSDADHPKQRNSAAPPRPQQQPARPAQQPASQSPKAEASPSTPTGTTATASGASSEPSAPPDKFDAEFPATVGVYRCTQIKVVPQGNSHMYLLAREKGDNIAFYGGDAFRAIGIDPKYWIDNFGHWFTLQPQLDVKASLADGKWTVAEMTKVTA